MPTFPIFGLSFLLYVWMRWPKRVSFLLSVAFALYMVPTTPPTTQVVAASVMVPIKMRGEFKYAEITEPVAVPAAPLVKSDIRVVLGLDVASAPASAPATLASAVQVLGFGN